MFYREKKVDCGRYREVDIVPRTDSAERAVRGKRRKRQRVSEPKQKDLNEKIQNATLSNWATGISEPGIFTLHLRTAQSTFPRRWRKQSGGSETI